MRVVDCGGGCGWIRWFTRHGEPPPPPTPAGTSLQPPPAPSSSPPLCRYLQCVSLHPAVSSGAAVAVAAGSAQE